MSRNQYKPNYPKTFSEAIRMLTDMRDENTPNTRFLKGHAFGLNIGINILRDLKRNIDESKELS